jgi:hypothetical protein
MWPNDCSIGHASVHLSRGEQPRVIGRLRYRCLDQTGHGQVGPAEHGRCRGRMCFLVFFSWIPLVLPRDRGPWRHSLSRHYRAQSILIIGLEAAKRKQQLGNHRHASNDALRECPVFLTCRRVVPCRRATSATETPGTRLSAAIRARSAFVRHRRPLGTSITSSRDDLPRDFHPAATGAGLSFLPFGTG